MNKTKIDWCDSTFNPVVGCYHNCEYCYARNMVKRFGKNLPDLSDFASRNKGLHMLDNKIDGTPYPFGFEPTFYAYKLNEYAKKKGRNIFVCSMADLFGEWVPDSWIEEVFKACEKAPQHNYLFLTKNPGRYCDLHRIGLLPDRDNIWFGATYDHSNWCGVRIDGRPSTFETDGKMVHDAGDFYFPMYPEKRRFVSLEPLLYDIGARIGSIGADWVIIGAETGNRKDKIIPKKEWVEHIVTYCADNNIPVFMKESLIDIWGEPLIQEFPEGLRKEGLL